ncbi:MAG: AfsR/SARP family transcriptional regulator, partial [Acidimicrobiales bacterium]
MDGGDQGAEIRLLGPVEVAVGGRLVEIGSAQQLSLIATLALHPGAVVSSESLIDVLWGDDPPATAHPTLRGLVARLRKALGGDGQGPVAWLRGKGSGYVLDLTSEQVDATRFERLSATGRDALARFDASVAAHALREALALWRGPAFGALSSSPAFSVEAHRLDEARLAATEDLAEAELLLGRPGDALARLEPHVEANPLRERAWGQLMLALYRLGRQADALRAFQAVRHVLAEELGVEPTPALRELEAGILQHRPDLITGGQGDGRPLAPVRPRPLGDMVAFLFTDIESSTKAWEGDADAMAADLTRHDKLLGEACQEWGGSV